MLVFGKRLKKRRKEKGYSNREDLISAYNERFADDESDKSGLGPRTLENYELGKTSPNIDRLFKLCEVLECDAGHLLGLYDASTAEAEATCKYTGLSEAAVAKLHEWASFGSEHGDYWLIPIIDGLISTEPGRELLQAMYLVSSSAALGGVTEASPDDDGYIDLGEYHDYLRNDLTDLKSAILDATMQFNQYIRLALHAQEREKALSDRLQALYREWEKVEEINDDEKGE